MHHLDLVDAGSSHAPGQREQPGARRSALAEGGERASAVRHDPRDVGQRLDVVHDGRLAVEADHGREERRLDPREAALALQGLEQRSLVAADVRAGAGVHDDVEAEARAEDVAPERAVRVGVVDRGQHPLEAEGELATDEDERPRDLERPGRDDDPFDQLVGVSLHEEAVLEGRGLGLVAIHDEVRDRVFLQHRPLAPRREPRTAAPEQRSGVHLLGDCRGGHRERTAERLVAARREVARERVAVVEPDPGRDDLRGVELGHQLVAGLLDGVSDATRARSEAMT